MHKYDVTVRVKAANSADAVKIVIDDLHWDYFGDEPANIWHEIRQTKRVEEE